MRCARRSTTFDAAPTPPSAPALTKARWLVVDGDAYYSRPGPRLADGVRQLGHLLHPDVVPDPQPPRFELGALRYVQLAMR